MKIIFLFLSIILITSFIPLSYSEDVGNIFDDLDENPESIDYFVEKGFKIYTLENQYGEYFIPYRTNSTLISITYSYIGGNGFILDVEPKKSYFEMIIPLFFFSDKISSYDDLILLANGMESFLEQKTLEDIFYVKFILNQNVTQVELFYPLISKEYSNPIFSTFTVNITNSIFFDIYPPKKQIQNNISINEISCNDDLQFIKKQHNNFVACVTESTKERLLDRGWMLVR